MLSNRRLDLAAALAFLVFGLAFLVGSVRYGDVRAGIPSAGLFPCIGGGIMILLSVLQLVSIVKDKADRRERRFFPEKYSWKRVTGSVLTLFLYAFSLKYLGFFLVTLLFMAFSLRFVEPLRWRIVTALSVVTSVFFYFVFEIWLKVQLPEGLLEGAIRWIF